MHPQDVEGASQQDGDVFSPYADRRIVKAEEMLRNGYVGEV